MFRLLLVLVCLGSVAGAVPVSPTVSDNYGLTETQRRAVWTQVMRGQLAISRQMQDVNPTRMLAAETRGEKQSAGSASLSCGLISKIHAQATGEPPLVAALHRRIRQGYGLLPQALEGLFREGERKGWSLPR